MKEKNSLYIPAAIVLAGFFIAVGIYMSGDRNTTTTTNTATNKITLSFKAVDKDDHINGDTKASIKMIEYSDTECPFCKMFHTTMHSLMDTYGKDGKVAWVYRHFPLDSLHQKTRNEAKATECVNKIGGNTAFWSMLDSIYTNTTSNDGLDPAKLPIFAKTAGIDLNKFNTCMSTDTEVAKIVEADYQDGLKAGVNGTPHTIIVLDKAIGSDKVKSIDGFVSTNRIYDRQGTPLVRVANKNTVVDVNGALPLEMMKSLMDIILK